MRFANVRELKNRTSEMLRIASGGRDVLITVHGKPVAVLHGLKEEDLEDYVLSRHPGLRASIEKAQKEYRRKGGESLERAITRLGKRRVRA